MTTFGSLFAGAGGFDLGFEAAGWTPSWQVEIDPAAQAVLRHWWPEVDLYEDITDLDGAELTPVDVIVGGFPCQDLSIAGRRAGMTAGETRSGLFYEMSRLVEEMRNATNGSAPQWVCWENVTGLLNLGNTLGSIYAEWDRLGAVVQEHRTIDTGRGFGIPQRRRRVFAVVGFATGADTLGEILADTEGVRRNPPPSEETRPHTSAGAHDGPGGRSGEAGEHLIPPAVNTVTASWENGSGNTQVDNGAIVPTYTGTLAPGRGQRLTADEAAVGHLLPTHTGTITARMGGAAMGAPEVDANLFLPTTTGTITTAFGPKNYSNLQEVLEGSILPTAEAAAPSCPGGDDEAALAEPPVDGGEDRVGVLGGDDELAVRPDLAEGTEVGEVDVVGDLGEARDIFGNVAGDDAADDVLSDRCKQHAEDDAIPGGDSVKQKLREMFPEDTLGVRRLTPLECERLMGFPEGHTAPAGREAHQYRLCGNGVIPRAAEWLARRIMAAEARGADDLPEMHLPKGNPTP